MADIDELLKSSFDRLAEPANSAGVADLIRSRVAAGDAGTAVAGTTAPGWKPPTPKWFWPLLGTVAGLALVLVILIVTLVLPSSAEPEPTLSPTPSATPTPTPTATQTPTPTPTPTEDQEEPPPPPPARDTTAPKVSVGQWSNGGVVYNTGSNYPTCNESADIVISATDDVGVVNVSAVTSMQGTQAQFIGFSGSAYTFRFSGGGAQTDTQINVTFTAIDEAGNSASVSRSVTLRPCIVIT